MKEERQAPTGKGRPASMKIAQAKATPIAEIEVVGEDRRLTNIGEFDRVLGGGVIPDRRRSRDWEDHAVTSSAPAPVFQGRTGAVCLRGGISKAD